MGNVPLFFLNLYNFLRPAIAAANFRKSVKKKDPEFLNVAVTRSEDCAQICWLCAKFHIFIRKEKNHLFFLFYLTLSCSCVLLVFVFFKLSCANIQNLSYNYPHKSTFIMSDVPHFSKLQKIKHTDLKKKIPKQYLWISYY